MQPYEGELCQITEWVWGKVLGLELQRRAEPLAKQPGAYFLTGCVQISGAWHGALALDCSINLARRITAIMFRIDAAQATIGDIRDALGELANITGGNVKALLPNPCRLSLPIVVDGSNYTLRMPGAHDVTNLNFECDNEPFQVELVQWTLTRRG